ncbi:gephyrin-like molybdotransferase receptor GlpR [uncultured Corynebacterium sp.]|uniref:divisome protein SepX/GlpR n=1 Tax=uncultured Corynebacterium sp. TaxID=159447 RepID=UPI0025FD6150|nr:gephyrin-like molybdotransferase receptor GlpR [uncultured Corynebacterium sp.]
MSSSLLLVLIVVVWLFVLAPLVINTRQPIRRTSDALGRTRLLHQGGESVPTRRRRPTLSERDVRRGGEEIDESLETVDAEYAESDARGRRFADLDDDILIDDVSDDRVTADRGRGRGRGSDDDAAEVPAVVEGDVVYELEPAEARTAESLEDAEVEAAEVGEAEDAENSEVESLDDASVADDVADDVAIARRVTVEGEDAEGEDAEQTDELSETDEAPASIGAARPVADRIPDDARAYLTPEDFLVVDDETAADEIAAEAGTDESAAADSEVDADERAGAVSDADADVYADDAAEDHADHVDAEYEPSDAEVDDVLTDDDLAFAERRRGRGGFDPVTDARYAETRFARRRRSVAALAAFIVVGVMLGALVGGWTWWVPLAGAGLMVLYLVYLRRTVLAENDLRARRIRRMKMARLGVRNSEDEELGVPERLRRPGAVVVELDDEDPDFADLPYSTYEYPEEDVRRASGQ